MEFDEAYRMTTCDMSSPILTRRAERFALGALSALAWFGVLLQLWLSIRLSLGNGKSVAHGLLVYLGYFTVLTNIFVAVITSSRIAGARTGLGSEGMRGCATTAILIVGLGYHLLLRDVWSPEGWQWVADIVLHYAVPLAALAYWCLFPPRARLPAAAPLAWSAYPVAYFVYAIARGKIIGSYPYYFIDVNQTGFGQVAINAIALLAAFIVLGYVIAYVARLAARQK